ncbi:hypothetical protein [Thiohalorhabdus methylotrophus]|uniref:Phage integrase family protein n=1 Tax=Thiohalorhabdus methylotrophus TaxID=3242694 RepID=A0ABV4U1C4_9GAMM
MSQRTERTVADYREKGRSLLDRFLREAAYPDPADAGAVVDWATTTLREAYSPATFRYYKAAFALVLEEAGHGLSAEALRGTQNTGNSSTRRTKTRRTSAKKAKKVHPDDARKLLNYLEQGRGAWDRLLAQWFAAGLFTGLRPTEWANARLDGETLVVANAKNTGGRSHGPERHLHITDPEVRKLLWAFLDNLNLAVQSESFDRAYKHCRVRLYQVGLVLWPRRQRNRITLYSTRHQFTADAKHSGLSGKEIAALMGHRVTETHKAHYGRRQAGRGQVQVAADPAETERVEQSPEHLRFDRSK